MINFKVRRRVVMKEIIISEDAPKPVGPYSQAIKVGNLVFVAGQGPIDPNTGKIVSGDIQEQTKQTFKNIEAILKAANLTIDHVVKVSVFLRNIGDFSRMNEVYATLFNREPPARTTVEANLPLKEMLIVADIVAAL